MYFFCTADQIGKELNTGAGIVCHHELKALKSMGEETMVFSAPEIPNAPFEGDQIAAEKIKPYLGKIKLAHFYSGTFSKTVALLKESGAKVTYTVCCHDKKISRDEHLKHGIDFDKIYPHLEDGSELCNNYCEGYLNADIVICPSKSAENIFKKYENYAKGTIEVISHGVYIPQKLEPVKTKPFTLAYLGAIGLDKGLTYLIEAWAKLNYKDAILVLAGRDSPSFLPIVRQIGKGTIHLAGWVNNVADLYNKCSVYVQPSATEGFGIEVLEAMAHQKATICSDGAGAADCIEHGQDGLVVKARNINDLCDAIDYYKKDEDKIIKHGINAREKAKEYSWDKIQARYCETWKNLIGQ